MTVQQSRYAEIFGVPVAVLGLCGFLTIMLASAARGERVRVAQAVVALSAFGFSAYLLFTRPGDQAAQSLALELGVKWAGAVGEDLPTELDAAIIFAPAGELVPAALTAVGRGGRVVCAGIHMTDIPSFPYELLWGERRLVANLTRADGVEFFDLLRTIEVRTVVETFRLEEAESALAKLRRGEVRGAAVLTLR
jgi:propanol-preferring alcohol dehydrogenase